jgi:hypothetical protein
VQTIQREPHFFDASIETRTGLSRSTIYQYIKDGAFQARGLVRARSGGSSRR